MIFSTIYNCSKQKLKQYLKILPLSNHAVRNIFFQSFQKLKRRKLKSLPKTIKTIYENK